MLFQSTLDWRGCVSRPQERTKCNSGFDDQDEVFDSADVNGVTRTRAGGNRGGEAGLPYFSANLDLSCWRERCADDGCCTDHGLGSGEYFIATGAKCDPGQAEGDDSEAEAGGYGCGGVDALLGDGAIDERRQTEDQGQRSAEGEGSGGEKTSDDSGKDKEE